MLCPEGSAGLVTRRVFIALAPAIVAPAQQDRLAVPGEKARFTDRATEMVLARLTSPSYDTWMPSTPGRGISARSQSGVVTMARGEGKSLVWLDYGTGAGRIIAEPADLDPSSVALTSDDRWIAYADGGVLMAAQRQGTRRQTLAKLSSGASLHAGLAPSPDRLTFYFAESAGSGSRIRSVRIGAASTVVAETSEVVSELAPNPRRALLAWRIQAGSLWLGSLDGGKPQRVETPGGRVLQFHWSSDGSSLLYLHEPADPSKLVEIRERQVDSRTDTLVAKTSQFASFAPNANGTAFVGASRSKASPHILLLLRATQREFTLCEHGDPEPALCRPVFTPDSQSILFTSRIHGKNCVYLAGVEKLIEKTSD